MNKRVQKTNQRLLHRAWGLEVDGQSWPRGGVDIGCALIARAGVIQFVSSSFICDRAWDDVHREREPTATLPQKWHLHTHQYIQPGEGLLTI